MPEDDRVRIHAEFGAEDIHRAMDVLDLAQSDSLLIWFCEDLSIPGISLPLLDAGMQVRLRATGDRTDGDSAVIIQPLVQRRPVEKWLGARHMEEVILEEQWFADRKVRAASFVRELDHDELSALGDPDHSISMFINDEQKRFADECVQFKADWDYLTPMGPINATRWKRVKSLNGAGETRAERWQAAGLDILELTIVADKIDANERSQALSQRLTELGIDVVPTQETKTRRFISALAADADTSSRAKSRPGRTAEQGTHPELRTGDIDKGPRKSDRTEFSPDTVAQIDLLGRKRLAEVLDSRIRRLALHEDPTQRGSFVVHVDGAWGSGKSTLLKYLSDELQGRDPRFLVVEVNAWREQRTGVQWWTLVRAVRRASHASLRGPGRWLAWLGAVWDRVQADRRPLYIALLVVVFVAVVRFTGVDIASSSEIADFLVRLVSLVSLAFAGAVAVVRYLLPWSRSSAQGRIEASSNPMQEVQLLFASALRRAGRPVVFFVDDLDRCDADYVVEFLEAMQTLARDAPELLPPKRRPAGPYAFIAADGQWLRSSYESHYNLFTQTGMPGRPLGYLFLEKIFQLRVRLPSITSSTQTSYLRELLLSKPREMTVGTDEAQAYRDAATNLSRATSEAAVVQAAHDAAQRVADPYQLMDILGTAASKLSEPEIEEATESELERFGHLLDPNPRSIKLFVNTYGVLRSLRTLEESFVDTAPLALWTIVEVRWPQLADQLRRNPSWVSQSSASSGVPEDMRTLLGDQDVRAVLQSQEFGPLTPELIRACSGAAGDR